MRVDLLDSLCFPLPLRGWPCDGSLLFLHSNIIIAVHGRVSFVVVEYRRRRGRRGHTKLNAFELAAGPGFCGLGDDRIGVQLFVIAE